MSQHRRDEFRAKAQAAHDAIDEYAECRLAGSDEWFTRGLDEKARRAVADLLNFNRRETVKIVVPLPSALELEDAEVIRSYVDSEMRAKLEEWLLET